MDLSGDGSITLDRRAFKALASETRVEILKRLDGTQKTVSDLARELSMNKATMFQHLEQLVEVGLVRKDTEEDRATTVKEAPFEAPVQGPPKKWVYYRLSWKGKNVLHPERVKIAIMLAIAAVACLLVVVVYAMAVQGPGAPERKDTLPPMVAYWDVEPVRTDSGVIDLQLNVQDNATGKVSGVDAGATVLRWGVFSDPSLAGPDISPWSGLNYTVSGSLLTARIPAADWSSRAGRYLVITADLRDRAGNAASCRFFEKVVPVSGPDLQVVPGSLDFGSLDRNSFRLSLRLSNTGSEDAPEVTVSVFGRDPDVPRTGRAAPDAVKVASGVAALVPAGGSETINLTVDNRRLLSRTIYLMADPDDEVLETEEGDNVMRATVPAPIPIGPTPVSPSEGKGFTPGMELGAALLALGLVTMLARRKLRER
ncbi:MAG: helix-turn-helix domain-containing protein [Euryarchaeota archaeon]|nr:helix-turn-helix domain-containing protein [Euryarchaeota archaeon]